MKMFVYKQWSHNGPSSKHNVKDFSCLFRVTFDTRGDGVYTHASTYVRKY